MYKIDEFCIEINELFIKIDDCNANIKAEPPDVIVTIVPTSAESAFAKGEELFMNK